MADVAVESDYSCFYAVVCRNADLYRGPISQVGNRQVKQDLWVVKLIFRGAESHRVPVKSRLRLRGV